MKTTFPLFNPPIALPSSVQLATAPLYDIFFMTVSPLSSLLNSADQCRFDYAYSNSRYTIHPLATVAQLNIVGIRPANHISLIGMREGNTMFFPTS